MLFINNAMLFINNANAMLFIINAWLFRNKEGLLIIPNTTQTKESLSADDSDSYFVLHLMIMP